MGLGRYRKADRILFFALDFSALMERSFQFGI